ncbi:MAG: Ig-like domain-containing protein [Xenococcaceae cyanobacterium MO_207.B15]|nr:Ig-like domain-containing protein [Xenococcaceae cyanobacterium MO_207.B15]
MNSFNHNLTKSLIEAIGQLPNSEDLLASLDQALKLTQERLQSFASDPDFDTKMRLAFGEEIDVTALGQAWTVGDFSVIPAIEIRPAAEINGANGAYAAATNTIYLAQEFLVQNAGNPEALAEVLLEEVGHTVDQVVNESDADGDEGNIFARLVRGETITEEQLQELRAENDIATVILDGQAIEIEQVFVVSHTNPSIKHEIIAQSDDIENGPSINDLGNVAFIAKNSNGAETIFIGNENSTTDIGFQNSEDTLRNFFGSVEINNLNQVVARDFKFDSQPFFRLRVWDGNNPGDFDIAIRNGSFFFTDFSHQYDVVSGFASINNNSEEVIAIALEFPATTGPTTIKLVKPDSFFPDLGFGSPTERTLGTSPLTVRPQIADDGSVVLRNGNTPSDPIVLFDDNLSNFQTISSGFTGVGRSPGISDNGQIVAFYGEDLDGPGIFVWSNGVTKRIAGISGNGKLDPGEGHIDLNSNGEVDPNEDNGIFSNFSKDTRIGITISPDSSIATVVYIAENKSNKKGLYASYFDFSQDNPFIDSVPSGPRLIIEEDNSIPNLSGQVKDINIYDPINTNNEVAFWVSTEDNNNASNNKTAIIKSDITPTASLVFREKQEEGAGESTWGGPNDAVPGWDHVGLHFNNTVYEAHSGYNSVGLPFYDPVEDKFISNALFTLGLPGVQSPHSLGSWQYSSPDPNETAVTNFESIEIPVSLGIQISEFINSTLIGKPFLPISNFKKTIEEQGVDGLLSLLNPDSQKGKEGSFSCVGLVEYAAEQIDTFNNGQGFVPNNMESMFIGGALAEKFPEELKNKTIPLLSPELMYWINNRQFSLSRLDEIGEGLKGLLDPVDFIITDPLGRRLGHTEELGTLNEIPDAFYSGNGDLEQFIIPDIIPGNYQIDLVGLDENALVIIGQEETSNGLFLNEFLTDGETRTFSLTTSEESENNLPLANDDTATTDEDASVTIDVLNNDTDIDGDSLSIDNFDATSSQNGTITLDDNNTPADESDDQLTYSPAAGFTGTDTFEYTVSDGTDNATATVTVTVNPVNDLPVAVDDTATTGENTTVDIDVLANDSDLDGDTLSIESFDLTSTAGGTISLDDNGTPDPSDDSLVYTPPTGFIGNDSFTYQISDGTDTATANVDITVEAPLATFATLSTPAGDGGLSVTVDAFGAFGSDATGDAFYDPVGNIDQAGTTFESAVAIRVGDTGSRTFLSAVDIGGSGNLINPDFTATTPSNAESTFSFLGLDFNLNQTVSETFQNGDRTGSILNQIYTMTNPGTDSVSFELVRYLDGDLLFDGSFTDGGGRFINGNKEILFETDTAGEPDTSTTFVGITGEGGVIDLPGRFEIDSYSGLLNRIINGTALDDTITNDGSDADEFVDAGLGYDITLALRNSFVLDPGQSTTYTTTTIFGSGAPEDVPVNESPEANPDSETTVLNTPVTINVLSNDTDGDGDSLNIEGFDATSTEGGIISLEDLGTPDPSDDQLIYTPPEGFIGTDTFTYTISDGTDTATGTVLVKVTADETEPNIINGTPGRDNIPGTDGNDIITGDQGRDVISTGDGNDVLVYTSIVDAGDIVTDFEVGQDKFDFSQLLDSFGYGGSAPFADGYVQIIANGSSSIITVDTDGVAGSGRARQFILVQNVAAEELNSSDNFKF